MITINRKGERLYIFFSLSLNKKKRLIVTVRVEKERRRRKSDLQLKRANERDIEVMARASAAQRVGVINCRSFGAPRAIICTALHTTTRCIYADFSFCLLISRLLFRNCARARPLTDFLIIFFKANFY